jgi:hypothetical protein
MAAKLFIVERGKEALFRSLSTVLRNELDVEVIYDRRFRDQKEYPDQHRASPCGQEFAHFHDPSPDKLLVRPAVERRVRTDIEQRLRADGYAVVRLSSDDTLGGNIRWS